MFTGISVCLHVCVYLANCVEEERKDCKIVAQKVCVCACKCDRGTQSRAEEGRQLLAHAHCKAPDGEMRSPRFDTKE